MPVTPTQIEMDIRGGYGIVSSDNGGSSTLGFCATRNGVKGYVIAGHAGDKLNEEFKYNGVAIGTVSKTAYYNNSTADAAFVTANSNGTTTNDIGSMDCWATSTYEFPAGTGISMLGKESGVQSGTIISYNASTNDGTYTVTNQVKASYTSTGGDSGAPIYIYDGTFGGVDKCTLIGIHRGTTGSNKVFSKYSNIASELGITAITN